MMTDCTFRYEGPYEARVAPVPCCLERGHSSKHMREIVCRYCWKVFTGPMHSVSVGCSDYCKGRLSAYARQINKSRWDMTGDAPTLPGMGKQVDVAIEAATL